MAKSKDSDLRPYAWEKIAFLEDANEDSRLTGAPFRVLQKICAAFNRKEGYSECARTFIVDRVPVSIKTVQRARKLLLAESRIFIVREPIGRSSTRYCINWWFRGADRIRKVNNGQPILDCRQQPVERTSVTQLEGTSASCPDTVEGTSTSIQMGTNVPPTARRGDMMSPKPIYIPLGENIYSTSAPGALDGLTATRRRAEVELIVTAAREEAGDGCRKLVVEFESAAGEAWSDEFIFHHRDHQVQEEGFRRLLEFFAGVEVSGLDNAVDLIGLRTLAIADAEIRYINAEVRRRMGGQAA